MWWRIEAKFCGNVLRVEWPPVATCSTSGALIFNIASIIKICSGTGRPASAGSPWHARPFTRTCLRTWADSISGLRYAPRDTHLSASLDMYPEVSWNGCAGLDMRFFGLPNRTRNECDCGYPTATATRPTIISQCSSLLLPPCIFISSLQGCGQLSILAQTPAGIQEKHKLEWSVCVTVPRSL